VTHYEEFKWQGNNAAKPKKLVEDNKKHQERHLPTDLWVQRLAKLEGFEEQVSPERHKLSQMYEICPFCKLSRGKIKQQRVAVIAEKLCLHCEMILLKNSNNCLKTCPFWYRSGPPAASWH